MEMSKNGLAELAGHEGICLEWYLDSVGVPTIGVGYTKGDGLAPKDISPLKSVEEALKLFKVTLKKYEDAVNKALRAEVTQEQFDALVSICYNIGIAGLSNSTFMRRINNNSPIGVMPRGFIGDINSDSIYSLSGRTDPSVVYSEARCLGILGGGTVVDAILMWRKPDEIIGRRKKEAKLYAKGIYSNNGLVNVFPVNVNHKPVYAKGKLIRVADLLYPGGLG